MATISMFGPTRAGKTSVVWAFLYKMVKYREQLLPDHPMELSLSIHHTGKDLDQFDAPPQPDGTRRPDFDVMRIARQPRNLRDYRQQVSAFVHDISLYDNQGVLFSAGSQQSIEGFTINKPEQFRSIAENVYHAWEDLRESATAVIVLLDPEALGQLSLDAITESIEAATATGPESLENETDPAEEPEMTEQERERRIREAIENRTMFTRNEYARMVNRLAQESWLPAELVLESGVRVRRKVAVCLSKSDLLQDSDTPLQFGVDKVIQRRFGDQMIEAIDNLRGHFGDDNVRTFALSALGFDREDGKPNFDPRDGWLKNPYAWEPIDVEQPFLWALERLERDYLRAMTETLPVARQYFRKHRLANHIPYLGQPVSLPGQ